jgi:predicted tellurium resistance membrane protein TerC
MIGLVLIADGFGLHIPKGYVYTAMAFSVFVELINLWVRKRSERAGAQGPD